MIKPSSLISFRNEATRDGVEFFESPVTSDPVTDFDDFDNIFDPRIAKVATSTGNPALFCCNWDNAAADPTIRVVALLGLAPTNPGTPIVVQVSMHDYGGTETHEIWSTLNTPLSPDYTANLFWTIPEGITGQQLYIQLMPSSGDVTLGGFWAGDAIPLRGSLDLSLATQDPGMKTASSGGQVYSNVRTKRRVARYSASAIPESLAIGYWDGSQGIIGGDIGNSPSLQDCFMYAGTTRPIIICPHGEHDMTEAASTNKIKAMWRLSKTSIYGTFVQEPSLDLIGARDEDDSTDENWLYRSDFEVIESL